MTDALAPKTSMAPKPREVWPTGEAAYQLLELIGLGASAKVHRAVCIENGRACAIKIVDLDTYGDALELISREISTMVSLDHPNVVSYHSSFVVQNALWLVVRYMDCGSAYDILRGEFPTGLQDEVLIATMLKETLQGLDYFHRNGHIHRDVKAGNILLDSAGHVAVGDFGVCAGLIEQGRRKKAQTFVGTPCWMAPEVMEQKHAYDQKVDIWSFGITALELADGSAPLSTLPPMKVLMTILDKEPPKLGRHRDGYSFSKNFKDMIALCLQKDPAQRPTATKLLEHKFFKQAKKSDYVVEALISRIPSLDVRLKKMQAKKDEDEQKSNYRPAESLAEWDFDEVRKAASSDGGPPALDVDPTAASSSSIGTGVGDEGKVKKGRFAIKESGNKDAGAASTVSAPAESKGRFTVKDNASSAANANAAAAPPEQKGRFAVKESTGSPTDPGAKLTEVQVQQILTEQQKNADEVEKLRAEMERLKAENERLKGQQD